MTIWEILIPIFTVIASIVGTIIAAKASIERVKSQNINDDASAVSLFEQAAANRQKENDALRSQINEITVRMQKLETAISGPFRIIIEFTTSPELKITRAEIELLNEEMVRRATEDKE